MLIAKIRLKLLINIKNMKKIYSIIIAAVSIYTAQAQTSAHKWGVGLDLNHKEYRGDLGNGLFTFKEIKNLMPGLRISRYLNPSFDLGLNFNIGKYAFNNPDTPRFTGFKMNNNAWDLNLNARYKFNNGYILKENALFGPYLTAGVSLLNLKNNNIPSGSTNKFNVLNFPVGAGVRVQLAPAFQLYAQSTYSFSMNDNYDNMPNIRRRNDNHVNHTIGLVYAFGKDNSDPSKKDSDKDGVTDDKDKCPGTKRGTEVDEKGCPKIAENVKQDIKLLATQIYFETNSSTLKSESYPALDKLAGYLKLFPKTVVDVSGHTDNTGNADYNMELSKKRADAVKAYLVSKGIAESRINSQGYGQTAPIDTNDTEEGKAKNRRVEINLHY